MASSVLLPPGSFSIIFTSFTALVLFMPIRRFSSPVQSAPAKPPSSNSSPILYPSPTIPFSFPSKITSLPATLPPSTTKKTTSNTPPTYHLNTFFFFTTHLYIASPPSIPSLASDKFFPSSSSGIPKILSSSIKSPRLPVTSNLFSPSKIYTSIMTLPSTNLSHQTSNTSSCLDIYPTYSLE